MSETLFYRSWGEPRPQVLLLIHPMGADGAFWTEAAERLASRYYCVACDLRSAGRSPVEDGPVSVAAHMRDMEALIEALGVSSVVPVGCAVGSMVAARFAAQTQTHVPAVVLSNPAIRFSSQACKMIETRADLALRDGLAAIADDVVNRAFMGLPGDAGRARFREMFLRQPLEGYVGIARGIGSADVTADLIALTAKTLLLTSANDVQLPPVIAGEARAIMKHAELRHVDDGAHFIPYQAPEQFASVVGDFLEKNTCRN